MPESNPAFGPSRAIGLRLRSRNFVVDLICGSLGFVRRRTPPSDSLTFVGTFASFEPYGRRAQTSIQTRSDRPNRRRKSTIRSSDPQVQQQRAADQPMTATDTFPQQYQLVSPAVMRGDGRSRTEVRQLAHRGQVDRLLRRRRAGRLQFRHRRLRCARRLRRLQRNFRPGGLLGPFPVATLPRWAVTATAQHRLLLCRRTWPIAWTCNRRSIARRPHAV